MFPLLCGFVLTRWSRQGRSGRRVVVAAVLHDGAALRPVLARRRPVAGLLRHRHPGRRPAAGRGPRAVLDAQPPAPPRRPPVHGRARRRRGRGRRAVWPGMRSGWTTAPARRVPRRVHRRPARHAGADRRGRLPGAHPHGAAAVASTRCAGSASAPTASTSSTGRSSCSCPSAPGEQPESPLDGGGAGRPRPRAGRPVEPVDRAPRPRPGPGRRGPRRGWSRVADAVPRPPDGAAAAARGRGARVRRPPSASPTTWSPPRRRSRPSPTRSSSPPPPGAARRHREAAAGSGPRARPRRRRRRRRAPATATAPAADGPARHGAGGRTSPDHGHRRLGAGRRGPGPVGPHGPVAHRRRHHRPADGARPTSWSPASPPRAGWARSSCCTWATTGRSAAEQIDEVFAAIGPDRTVLLVNVLVPRRWEGEVNDQLAAAAARHPNAVLVDWRSLVTQRAGVDPRRRLPPHRRRRRALRRPGRGPGSPGVTAGPLVYRGPRRAGSSLGVASESPPPSIPVPRRCARTGETEDTCPSPNRHRRPPGARPSRSRRAPGRRAPRAPTPGA